MKVLGIILGIGLLVMGVFASIRFYGALDKVAAGVPVFIYLGLGVVFIKAGLESEESKNKKKAEQERRIQEIKEGGSAVLSALKHSKPIDFVGKQLVKAKKTAEINISKSHLTGCTWMRIDNNSNINFTFRNNGELLITTNGNVERGSYEFIVDNNSILIFTNGITEHYNIINLQDDFLFLNKMSTDIVLIFANYTKYKDELKSAIYQDALRLM